MANIIYGSWNDNLWPTDPNDDWPEYDHLSASSETNIYAIYNVDIITLDAGTNIIPDGNYSQWTTGYWTNWAGWPGWSNYEITAGPFRYGDFLNITNSTYSLTNKYIISLAYERGTNLISISNHWNITQTTNINGISVESKLDKTAYGVRANVSMRPQDLLALDCVNATLERLKATAAIVSNQVDWALDTYAGSYNATVIYYELESFYEHWRTHGIYLSTRGNVNFLKSCKHWTSHLLTKYLNQYESENGFYEFDATNEIVFPLHTITGLLNRVGAPTNYFDYTPDLPAVIYGQNETRGRYIDQTVNLYSPNYPGTNLITNRILDYMNQEHIFIGTNNQEFTIHCTNHYIYGNYDEDDYGWRYLRSIITNLQWLFVMAQNIGTITNRGCREKVGRAYVTKDNSHPWASCSEIANTAELYFAESDIISGIWGHDALRYKIIRKGKRSINGIPWDTVSAEVMTQYSTNIFGGWGINGEYDLYGIAYPKDDFDFYYPVETYHPEDEFPDIPNVLTYIKTTELSGTNNIYIVGNYDLALSSAGWPCADVDYDCEWTNYGYCTKSATIGYKGDMKHIVVKPIYEY